MTTSNKTADDYVLEVLQKNPANTYELRNLGVFSPAGSIERLREQYEIETVPVTIKDKFNIPRRKVAEYHLKGDKNG